MGTEVTDKTRCAFTLGRSVRPMEASWWGATRRSQVTKGLIGSKWECEKERRSGGVLAVYTVYKKSEGGRKMPGHASQTSEAGRSVAEEKVRQSWVQQTSEWLQDFSSEMEGCEEKDKEDEREQPLLRWMTDLEEKKLEGKIEIKLFHQCRKIQAVREKWWVETRDWWSYTKIKMDRRASNV